MTKSNRDTRSHSSKNQSKQVIMLQDCITGPIEAGSPQFNPNKICRSLNFTIAKCLKQSQRLMTKGDFLKFII